MKFPLISAACAFILCAAVAASAQVTRLEIVTQTAVSGGPFGRAGAYENIRGRIHGEVDPARADPEHGAVLRLWRRSKVCQRVGEAR